MKKFYNNLIMMAVAFSVVVFTSCDEDIDEPLVEPIFTLNPTSATLTVGETLALTIATNSDGVVSYSSNNTEVATVDANGEVIALVEGTAIINASVTATANYKADTAICTITVQPLLPAGEWSGDFGMYCEAQHPRTGRWYAFDADYTNLKFYQYDEYSTHGYGKQVDFYREGPYAYQYYDFYWEVRNGIIYLDYPYDPELNVAIRDYRLNYSKFSGWIGDVHFELYKLRDFYWDSYDGYYGCGWNDGWYWDDYYYSKTRNGNNADSEDMGELNIRRGNRFMEGKKSAE